MKMLKVVLPICLIFFLCIGWISTITGAIKTMSTYNACVKEAEESVKNGLYEQGIEFYKDALNVKNSKTVYKKIKETYDALYKEEHVPAVRNDYINDMATAATAFPKHEEFWVAQIKLYQDAKNYSKAYQTSKKALNHGASGKELDKLHKELKYMTKVDYKLYSDFATALNEYITVFDGNRWRVLDESGEKHSGEYNLIGLINDDGKGLYINDIDTRILDKKEVTRARFNLKVEKAGYYNEELDLVPVMIDGKWKYINSDGKAMNGEFDVAGSFFTDKAVAKLGETWFLLDAKGNKKELTGFEDIKLDLYGSYIQDGIILAKQNGKYHIYDTEFKQVGKFSADDIDIRIKDNPIAFKSGEKWGYVNSEGKVVIEPQYAYAKSFSNGYAAVGNKECSWGFITKDNELVIDYEYRDAYYFNSKKICMVSTTENTVQVMSFMFD